MSLVSLSPPAEDRFIISLVRFDQTGALLRRDSALRLSAWKLTLTPAVGSRPSTHGQAQGTVPTIVKKCVPKRPDVAQFFGTYTFRSILLTHLRTIGTRDTFEARATARQMIIFGVNTTGRKSFAR